MWHDPRLSFFDMVKGCSLMLAILAMLLYPEFARKQRFDLQYEANALLTASQPKDNVALK